MASYKLHNKPSSCKHGFLKSPYYYRNSKGQKTARYCKMKKSHRRSMNDPTRASSEPWERKYRKRTYGRASRKGVRQR